MNIQEDYGGGCGLPKQNRVWRVVLDALPNRCYQCRKKCNKMCFIRIVKDTKISIQKTMLFSNKVTKLALLARAVARVSKKTRSGKIVGLAGTLFLLFALHIWAQKLGCWHVSGTPRQQNRVHPPTEITQISRFWRISTNWWSNQCLDFASRILFLVEISINLP